MNFRCLFVSAWYFIFIFYLCFSLIFKLLLRACDIYLFFLFYLFIHPRIYFQKIADGQGSCIIIIIITIIISYYYYY